MRFCKRLLGAFLGGVIGAVGAVGNSTKAQEIDTAETAEAAPPAEEKAKQDFSFQASAGIAYDSNVSVIDIDLNTAAGDEAAVLDAGLAFASELGQNSKAVIGYNFSQSLHFDLTAFDVQIHRPSVTLEHKLGPVTGSLTYMFVHARLGGEGFLSFHRVSPALAGFLVKNVYLRGAYEFTDKNFKNRPERDSIMHAVGVTAFIFFDGTTTYVTTGYKFKSEDALDPQFDYHGHTFRIDLTHKFTVGGRKLVFKTGWRFEDRNYSAVTPSIGAIRDDTRHQFRAVLQIPVSGEIFVELEHKFNNFNSNLPSADFNQNVFTASVGGRF